METLIRTLLKHCLRGATGIYKKFIY